MCLFHICICGSFWVIFLFQNKDRIVYKVLRAVPEFIAFILFVFVYCAFRPPYDFLFGNCCTPSNLSSELFADSIDDNESNKQIEDCQEMFGINVISLVENSNIGASQIDPRMYAKETIQRESEMKQNEL